MIILEILAIWIACCLIFALMLTIFSPRRKRAGIMFKPGDVPLQHRRRPY